VRPASVGRDLSGGTVTVVLGSTTLPAPTTITASKIIVETTGQVLFESADRSGQPLTCAYTPDFFRCTLVHDGNCVVLPTAGTVHDVLSYQFSIGDACQSWHTLVAVGPLANGGPIASLGLVPPFRYAP
jgi:hypothetical protein